jgi:WD40 repeat protein
VCDTVQGYDVIRLYGAKWVDTVDFSPDGARIASCGFWRDPTVTVWETATGAMIERIAGLSDVTAIASGAMPFPFRLIVIVLGDTVIEHAGSGQAIAWLPGGLSQPATHPCGRLWAGGSNYVGLFQLEGSAH